MACCQLLLLLLLLLQRAFATICYWPFKPFVVVGAGHWRCAPEICWVLMTFLCFNAWKSCTIDYHFGGLAPSAASMGNGECGMGIGQWESKSNWNAAWLSRSDSANAPFLFALTSEMLQMLAMLRLMLSYWLPRVWHWWIVWLYVATVKCGRWQKAEGIARWLWPICERWGKGLLCCEQVNFA